jgi:hypothetical protein
MTDLVNKPVTPQESELIDELRRAKLRSKRKPETFVIRAVNGILQLQITVPFHDRGDDHHLDKRGRKR